MTVAARRLPSSVWVTGLTVGAVAVVAALAVKAEQGPQPHATAAKPKASASAKPSGKPSQAAEVAVPDESGTGRRVVYSLGQKRVWLVDASEQSRRTFVVWPGSVSPEPGRYTVGQRDEARTGSDGVPIEHVMFFATGSGLSIAFSNAVDGASPRPAPGVRTGGIRMSKADGTALWAFGDTGTAVTVVK
ncbi:L,D-transpeptidase [Streptomyces sp. NRRL WC-3618]|uniref:L,D-transpeptidase n=1 Tax=Streptomyces sp. NRRL WC-3618 TaxID=1519490 RepID=UPI0006AE179A|nr:L,D-transpeptidase [Streptomyces sp. NRRL WC-3618]